MTGAMRRLTRRRFNELVATQARIKREWWECRMQYSNVGKPYYRQRKRERVLNLIESTLNDMCFFGLIDADGYHTPAKQRPININCPKCYHGTTHEDCPACSGAGCKVCSSWGVVCPSPPRWSCTCVAHGGNCDC